MKATLITILRIIPILFTIIIWSSCSQDIEMTNDASNYAQKVKVRLKVNKVDFDSQGTTRTGGSGTGWESGETIYLKFDNGSVSSTAVYNAKSNDWRVNLNGLLTHDTHGKVEAYYFDQPASATTTEVSLAATSGVYHDAEGVYNYTSGGDLDIMIVLRPITSRIRFKGTPGENISINSGITTYSSFNTNIFSLKSNNEVPINITIGNNGYTPYVYGKFTNVSSPSIEIVNGSYVFTTNCPTTMFNVGESGWMNTPTKEAHNGWTLHKPKVNKLTFTVVDNGKIVTFNLILVEAGTFLMGSETGGSKAAHTVTLTNDYYMGETEVTQALWYAVMGQSPTSDASVWNNTYGKGDNRPAYYMSYNDCKNFLTKLNQMTGETFRLPTEAEWEFAAKGGNNSNGFTFAGSNSIGNVAWYSENAYDIGSSSSNYGTHDVKTKAANELGIYDMSGNVWEWCLDWYDSYSNDTQINPTGPATGTSRVARGGAWYAGASYCRTIDRNYGNPTTRDTNFGRGFRLALSTNE